VSVEAIEAAVNQVKHSLRTQGDREVPARLLGEQVMDVLRGLDEVAYVRFASVYRDFKNVSEFQDEIARLSNPPGTDTPAERS